MRPEAALLIAMAAGNAEGLCAAMRAEPDLRRVEKLAALHQVDAICWWMLRIMVNGGHNLCSDEFPVPLYDRLRSSYLHHRLRNEALVEDLTVLQDALFAQGVEGLYVKGPWMVLQAYPDPGMRPVGDIDLCVREKQYLAAIEALQAAGWRPCESMPTTPSEALARSHYRRQLRFLAKGRREIELHFRLINMGPPGDEDWVWKSARELRAGSCSLRVPGPEAMLLHLLLHANQHGFAVLRLLHDIRWALEGDRLELNSAVLINRIHELRCQASCYYALRLAEELANAAVPDTMLDALRPAAVRRAFFTITWRLQAARRLETPRRRMETESPVFYLLEMGRTHQKAYFVARLIAEAGGPRRLLAEGRRIFSEPHLSRRRKEQDDSSPPTQDSR